MHTHIFFLLYEDKILQVCMTTTTKASTNERDDQYQTNSDQTPLMGDNKWHTTAFTFFFKRINYYWYQ